MEMEKVYSYGKGPTETETMETSWGAITATHMGLLIRINNVGELFVYGYLIAEKLDGKVKLSGTEYDSAVTALKGELKA